MLPIRTILHPTDFSERSEDAFQTACSLARDHGAHLVVLYVQEPAVVGYAEYTQVVPDPVQTPADVKDKLSARHQLRACLSNAEPRPADVKANLSGRHGIDAGLDVEYRVAEGDPATEIIRLAQELAANLIVMGTHGRTGLGRLLMGSVAEAVLRRAPCPVLTLKAPFFVGATEPAAATEEPAAV